MPGATAPTAALARRHKYADEAAVLMIDVDGLKQINDKGGHAVGDDYLRSGLV